MLVTGNWITVTHSALHKCVAVVVTPTVAPTSSTLVEVHIRIDTPNFQILPFIILRLRQDAVTEQRIKFALDSATSTISGMNKPGTIIPIEADASGRTTSVGIWFAISSVSQLFLAVINFRTITS